MKEKFLKKLDFLVSNIIKNINEKGILYNISFGIKLTLARIKKNINEKGIMLNHPQLDFLKQANWTIMINILNFTIIYH